MTHLPLSESELCALRQRLSWGNADFIHPVGRTTWHRLLDDLAAAKAKLATVIEMFVADGYSRDWIMRSLLAPHSADPSSAPPPVGDPATPPSGR